jgi:hypothetical protein
VSTAIFLLLSSFQFSVSDAKAESQICSDPLEFVCSNKEYSRQKSMALEIRTKAATESQLYFSDPAENAQDYIDKITDQIKNNTDSKKQRAWINRGLFYVSCLDYISRAYFNSANDYSYSGVSCVTEKTSHNLKNDLDKMGNLQFFQKTYLVFQNLKQLVLQVVKSSQYSEALKPLLISQVSATDFASVQTFALENLSDTEEKISEKKISNDNVAGTLSAFIQACDPKAESENAFNYSVTDASEENPSPQHKVVLCPSMWLYGTSVSEINSVPNSAQNIRTKNGMARDHTAFQNLNLPLQFKLSGHAYRLVPAILHEIGHSIDSSIQDWLALKQTASNQKFLSAVSQTKKTFTSCIQKRHVDTGELIAERPAYSAESDESFAAEPNSADLFFAEYHADTISANALSLYLLKYPADRRAEVFSQGVSFLCGISNHEEHLSPLINNLHPSGVFRIRDLFMQNKMLRETLGCSRSAEPSCSFLTKF